MIYADRQTKSGMFPRPRTLSLCLPPSGGRGQRDREVVLTDTDCCLIPAAFFPKVFTSWPFIPILLVPCFLSVDLPGVYSQTFPNSLSPPSELLPHSTLWECGRRRSAGDVTLGMQRLQT